MFLHSVDDLVDPTGIFLLRFRPQCAVNGAFDIAMDAKMPDRLIGVRASTGRLVRAPKKGGRSCQRHQAASRDHVKFYCAKAGRLGEAWLAQPPRRFFLRRRAFFSSTAQTAAVSSAPRPLASAAL